MSNGDGGSIVVAVLVVCMLVVAGFSFLNQSDDGGSGGGGGGSGGGIDEPLPSLEFTRYFENPILIPTGVEWEHGEFADSCIVEESDRLSLYYSVIGAGKVVLATAPLEYPPVDWTRYDDEPLYFDDVSGYSMDRLCKLDMETWRDGKLLNDDDGTGASDGVMYNVVNSTGFVGGAQGFNGVDSSVILPLVSSKTHDVSVMAWFKTNDNAQKGQCIVYVGSDAVGNGYGLFVNSESSVDGRLRVLRGALAWDDLGIVINSNSWYCVVMTLFVDHYEVWLNGGKIYTSGVCSINVPTSYVCVGMNDYYDLRHLNGSIDEVRMFDRDLTGGEIGSLFDFNFYVPSQIRMGCVMKLDVGVYRMYYTAVGGNGCMAISDDGVNWTHVGVVLVPTAYEHTIEDIAVIRMSEVSWYMYYSWRNATDILPSIRVCTSVDGVTWEKHGLVLQKGLFGAWDDVFVEHHQILFVDGMFVLLYEAYGGSGSEPWMIGLAYSVDPLVEFTKFVGNPIFRGTDVEGDWDEVHVDCPWFFVHGGVTYLFYGGSLDEDYAVGSGWSLGLAYTTDSIEVWLW